MSDVTITHIGGPTALIEVGGWRILTDPTFDPPGKRYFFGWGTMSRKLAGPSILAKDLGPIDAVLVSHHHHGDNLDPSAQALLPGWGTTYTTQKAAKKLGSTSVGPGCLGHRNPRGARQAVNHDHRDAMPTRTCGQ